MSWFDPNDGITVEDCDPVKDVMAFDEKLKDGKLYRENPILVPEGYYDTAVRVAKENNIAVKIEPVDAKTGNRRDMKLLRDKTIDILDSALAEIQLREWEARKSHEFRFADGLNSAWRFLADMRDEYVNQKAKRNPIFRWRIWRGYKKASKAIRDVEL